MIDEQETRLQFGYYSESLSHGSNKKVYVICNECGYKRIMKFQAYVKTHGHCKSCAYTGKKLSEEHKHTLSKVHAGKHHSEKTKRKMSKSHIGKQHTIETKCKISKSGIGKHVNMSGNKNPMFGKIGENSPAWKGGKKLSSARKNIKRRELFGFIPHNLPQENFHGHHLDFNHVIFIPAELHRSISHSVVNDKNMDLINNVVCDWYLKDQGVKL